MSTRYQARVGGERVENGVISKNEPASLDNSQNVTAPIVSMARHKALSWSVADRANMAKKLEEIGCTITELSDVREACGLPRLSSTEARVRWAAPHILRSERGQKALESVRIERALLLEALGTLPKDTVSEAVILLRLRGGRAQWRLCELRAAYAQARLLELELEQGTRRAA